jgi:hypothetical protein
MVAALGMTEAQRGHAGVTTAPEVVVHVRDGKNRPIPNRKVEIYIEKKVRGEDPRPVNRMLVWADRTGTARAVLNNLPESQKFVVWAVTVDGLSDRKDLTAQTLLNIDEIDE